MSLELVLLLESWFALVSFSWRDFCSMTEVKTPRKSFDFCRLSLNVIYFQLSSETIGDPIKYLSPVFGPCQKVTVSRLLCKSFGNLGPKHVGR